MKNSPGSRFRQALHEEKPLQIVGTINAYAALMAKDAGFQAIYLSGAGVANSSFGLPDLGLTTMDNVLEDVNRITNAVDIPLLVDIDTGWGNELMIARSIKAMIRAGVAAVHIEDQATLKRCGHRHGKSLVSKEEMVARICAALDVRTDREFMVIARTDALATEGLDSSLERSLAYKEAGADALFLEAAVTLEQYRIFKEALGIPILANMTEFGRTPLHSAKELGEAGVDMVLYPLSANRAMNKAAFDVFKDIREHGSQKLSLPNMQTREQLYTHLHYDEYEKKADCLLM
jgi:methylisocitrate lyase